MEVPIDRSIHKIVDFSGLPCLPVFDLRVIRCDVLLLLLLSLLLLPLLEEILVKLLASDDFFRELADVDPLEYH